MMDEDLVLFAHESEAIPKSFIKPWKVLIADDDHEVHVITKLALDDYRHLGQPIEFFDSYDKKQTLQILRETPDLALVLLDVVMDERDAGLKVVKFIRETLRNSNVRIILRTGEPGSAPEKEVVTHYDINDYKEKTELTSTKLYTAVHTSIKNFCDIRTIKAGREGFSKVIKEAADLYRLKDYSAFVQSAVEQFVNLMQSNPDVILLKSDGELDAAAFKLDASQNRIRSLAGTGYFKGAAKSFADELLDKNEMKTVLTACTHGEYIFENGSLACAWKSEIIGTFIIFFKDLGLLKNFDSSIVIVFLSHICRGMENLTLQMNFNKSQNEIIHKLGEVVEFRSEEETVHVVRVSKITNIICESLGWSNEDLDNITLASVLHDLGKISISDSVLYKPGKLNSEEFSKVMNHTTVGNNLLKNSSQTVLKLAAVIALEHHEKWDGTGYPNGKKGKNISIHARIVSIADVYDALRSLRSYKQPWSRKEACDYILSERGQQFDPLIVDCFVKCESEINFLFK
tara:strand:- start:245 stop:1789 length:1545 start_codon:yes stop_codon:yes gene_type:complete